jgi:uncharacterized caspase-like protein
MKPIIMRITLFTMFFSLLPSSPGYSATERGVAIRPVAPTGEEVRGSQWLFVIGIDNYLRWPKLRTAVNDAKAVRDVLTSRYHFDKDHLYELYDAYATRANILNTFRTLATQVKPEDSLLIFYAGHGNMDSITKAGSWVPVESGLQDASAWISNHDVKNYLNVDAIKGRHILLVSDSCFAGDFFRGYRGPLPAVNDAVIKRAYQLSSRQAITSGGLEPVSDAGFGGNSVFSHFFVSALRDNRKPHLIPSDLFPVVKAGVAQNAEQFPQLGGLYGVGGQEGGEYVFFLKQEDRLQGLAADTQARQAELERLRRMEAEAAKAKEKEQAEISRKEQEVAELDALIAAMRSRLGTSAAGVQDSLQGMLAMVQQKEKEARQLEELKKQREEEDRKRQVEITKLKAEAEAKMVAAIEQDIATYEKIVASPYGKDMAAAAWQSLVNKYPEAKNTAVGDVNALQGAFNMPVNKNGRFIAYYNGTVLDTKTNLMWASKDNGSQINWANAKSYCENYRGGGYTDWRMPTQYELAGLYAEPVFDKNGYSPTNLIKVTQCCPWASETRSSFFGSDAAYFSNYRRVTDWKSQSSDYIGLRVLPVRYAK